jgi:hypothetical protein
MMKITVQRQEESNMAMADMDSTSNNAIATALNLVQEWREAIERDNSDSDNNKGIYEESRTEQKGYCAGELEALLNSERKNPKLVELITQLAGEWKQEPAGKDLRSEGKKEQRIICAEELEAAICR